MIATRLSGLAVGSVVAAALLAGCAKPATANCAGVIYVSVSSSGATSINGVAVSDEKIDSKLQSLKGSAKYVWYYRERGQTEPSDALSRKVHTVLDAVMRLGLPISLSSNADFSDSVDEDGKRQPRGGCPN